VIVKVRAIGEKRKRQCTCIYSATLRLAIRSSFYFFLDAAGFCPSFFLFTALWLQSHFLYYPTTYTQASSPCNPLPSSTSTATTSSVCLASQSHNHFPSNSPIPSSPSSHCHHFQCNNLQRSRMELAHLSECHFSTSLYESTSYRKMVVRHSSTRSSVTHRCLHDFPRCFQLTGSHFHVSCLLFLHFFPLCLTLPMLGSLSIYSLPELSLGVFGLNVSGSISFGSYISVRTCIVLLL
jgi:hypothetical protein